MAIDPKIIRFIQKHHQFTLVTVADNLPWTANCFFVYMELENQLVFTTSTDTRHGREMTAWPRVAGNISLETNVIGKIQGLQFTGTAVLLEDDALSRAKTAYIKRFPVAMLMETTLWAVIPDHYKLTDNRLGFGKKLIWNQDADNQANQT
jgi:uncharacterized protein YhbP (UPF0306 family)